MLNLPEKLDILEKEKKQIGVGIVGVGRMGAGLATLIARMKGMDVFALADLEVEKAVQIFQEIGIPQKEIFCSSDPEECNRALEKGMRVVTSQAETLPYLSILDAIVEATGVPSIGAKVAFESIRFKKHIIMMNIEADVTVGCLLANLARNANVVYTVGAGDEPSALKELYDFATALEFEVVAAGKGKNNPLDRKATPSSLKETASKKGVSPTMLTEFVDGSKTMIEMTSLANATGLIPDVRGMHGPKCEIPELSSIFALKEEGGILNQMGVVDYALGSVSPGVFVVVNTGNDRMRRDLEYMKMGSGPNYLLYRPYHLANIEVPFSIARAVIYREPTLAPVGLPTTETITVAKRDLSPGVKLDGIGGFDVYGSIERSNIARREGLLPLGLAEGAVIKRSVNMGEYITYDQAELAEFSFLVSLRKIQDETFFARMF